jgi:hypothetical protein
VIPESGYRARRFWLAKAEGNRSLNHERVSSKFVRSARLLGRSKGAGLLELLGYRKLIYLEPDFHGGFDLVFELPMSCVCECLAGRIVSTPTPDLVERLRLCRAVANAVVSVHEACTQGHPVSHYSHVDGHKHSRSRLQRVSARLVTCSETLGSHITLRQ